MYRINIAFFTNIKLERNRKKYSRKKYRSTARTQYPIRRHIDRQIWKRSGFKFLLPAYSNIDFSLQFCLKIILQWNQEQKTTKNKWPQCFKSTHNIVAKTNCTFNLITFQKNHSDVFLSRNWHCHIFGSLVWCSHSVIQLSFLKLELSYCKHTSFQQQSKGKLNNILRVSRGLGTHLFVKVPRPGDSEETLSVFESSSHLPI